MSRRGNCHDNAVAESFFQLLKRERIRRRTYLSYPGEHDAIIDPEIWDRVHAILQESPRKRAARRHRCTRLSGAGRYIRATVPLEEMVRCQYRFTRLI